MPVPEVPPVLQEWTPTFEQNARASPNRLGLCRKQAEGLPSCNQTRQTPPSTLVTSKILVNDTRGIQSLALRLPVTWARQYRPPPGQSITGKEFIGSECSRVGPLGSGDHLVQFLRRDRTEDVFDHSPVGGDHEGGRPVAHPVRKR
jgi:hypothetical protein